MKELFAKYGIWLVAAASCLCAVFVTAYALLHLRVGFADDQVAVFKAMEVHAGQDSDPRKVTGFMQYAMDYYPSGTKQNTGTPLDRIVEDERSRTIGVIMGRLRILTGRDLGSDPQNWLKAYPPAN